MSNEELRIKSNDPLPFSPHQFVTHHLVPTPRHKRLFDIAFSVALLLCLLPLFGLIALLVYIEDGRPIFYTQKRVGRGGRLFNFIKFRSMYRDADARRAALLLQQTDSVRFKMTNDPRITRIGKWIRRGSIDELPQFWNVLRGDMSVVGPRPALPEEVATYSTRQLRRLRAEQGLTCIWQVSGRSLIPFEQQVEMDLEYIERRSFWLDLKLILQTIPAVLSQRGAY